MITTVYEPHKDYPQKMDEAIKKFGRRLGSDYLEINGYIPNFSFWYQYVDGKYLKLEYYSYNLEKCYLYKIHEYEDVYEMKADLQHFFRNYHDWIPKGYIDYKYDEAFEDFVETLKKGRALTQFEVSTFGYRVTLWAEKELKHLKPKPVKIPQSLIDYMKHLRYRI